MITDITPSDIPISLYNNCHKLIKPGKLYQLLRIDDKDNKTEIWVGDIGIVIDYNDINDESYEGVIVVSMAPDGIFMVMESTTTLFGIHYTDKYKGPLDPVFRILTSGGVGWVSFSHFGFCAAGYYFRELSQ